MRDEMNTYGNIRSKLFRPEIDIMLMCHTTELEHFRHLLLIGNIQTP